MMARNILFFILLLFCVVIYQALLADIVSIGLARPDIILVFLVWLTLTRDLTWGVAFGFAAGLLEDSHNPQLLGLGALLNVLSALAVFLVSHRVRTDSLVIRIAMVIGVVVLHDMIYSLVAFSFDIHLDIMILFNTIIPSALYTSLIAAGVMYLSQRRLTLRFES